jgi:multidrug efflux system membrane fusion protein
MNESGQQKRSEPVEPPRAALVAAPSPSPPPRRRGRWIALAAIGAVVVGALLIRARMQAGGERPSGPGAGGRAGAGADRVVPVLVARAATRDVPLFLEGLGSVTAFKTVNVRTQVDGRLDKVLFREGQAVKRGDLLAQIDPRPFTIQLHQAQAALARDRAQLEGAQRNLTRYLAVAAERLIPQQQVDDQRALVEQLQASTQADQALIETARLQLDYAGINAPIDGVTGLRLVDPGNVVHPGDVNGLVVVTQLDPIAILFTLAQDDLPRVVAAQAQAQAQAQARAQGQPAGPVVEAMSRDGAQKLASGELALIDNQINQNTATIRLKAIFPNPQHTLWPNQFVKARLQLTVRKSALVIPAVAVQRGPQGAFVYVVGADDKAAIRAVVVDALEGELALLSKGVAPGERVVTEGQNQLRPGARVTVRDADARAGRSPGGAGAGAGDRAGRRSGGGSGKPAKP